MYYIQWSEGEEKGEEWRNTGNWECKRCEEPIR